MSNTHNAVCHAWAHQTGKHRRGFNMYYDGLVIFSYGRHFPIARIVETPDAGKVVLFTSKGYSVSTGKHKTHTRRACSHMTVFEVPDVLADNVPTHSDNWDHYIVAAKDAIDKAKRARTYKDMWLRNAYTLLVEAGAYSQAFGLGKPIITPETLEPTFAAMKAEAQAQAERDRVARERSGREILREQRAHNKPLVLRWLKGDDVSRNIHTRRPLVRVHGDKVETSWGASVPLDDGLLLFRLATKVRKSGKGWEASGLHGLKVGDFALTRIGPTGNMVIGCHDIPYRFAKVAADLAGISI